MSHQKSDPIDGDSLMNTIYRLEMDLAVSEKRENQNKEIIDKLKQENDALKHIYNSQELSIIALQAQIDRLTAQNDQLQAQNNAL